MISLIFILISSLFLYISTLSNTVYGGDSGDLVSAIIAKGFPHPPGYPLYTFIGRFFINLPINSLLTAAGKITIISSLSTVFSLILIFLILDSLLRKKINRPIAILTILIISVNYLIWLYAIVPEVFPLNVLITLGIFFSGLLFKNTGKLKWLTLILSLIGLGVSHHHTFILILPSVLILTYSQLKKIKFTLKKTIFLVLSTFIGLLPLAYLPIVSQSNPEIIWGEADSFSGFIAILTRQAYGSFVPGSFISNLPITRFIQLINLNNFVFDDFTLVGYLSVIIGLVILLRSKIIDKKEKNAIFLALFLFGPFFVFYANFPLSDKFTLATTERFMIMFYFLLSIPLYFGLNWFYSKITTLFKHILRKKYEVFIPIIVGVFFLYPISLSIKNYRRLVNLKSYPVAEKLGRDVLNSTDENSIILLYADTLLFNTQYVYYSNKNAFPGRIPLQTNKITSEYYQRAIKFNYPRIVFRSKKDYNFGDFIKDNIKNYNIYSTDKYSFPSSFPYKWVVRGLLFKLVPQDYDNASEEETNIQSFWTSSENKNLADYYLSNHSHWFNFFSNDILRIYSTAHQNTAYYYLNTNKPELAFPHIEQALILNPEDLDSLFLQSVYYMKLNNCVLAEKSIIQALAKNKDRLYIFQLDQLAQCYKDDTNKQRIKSLIKKYSDQPLKKLID